MIKYGILIFIMSVTMTMLFAGRSGESRAPSPKYTDITPAQAEHIYKYGQFNVCVEYCHIMPKDKHSDVTAIPERFQKILMRYYAENCHMTPEV